jgi:release factor glutamine methyltransferase
MSLTIADALGRATELSAVSNSAKVDIEHCLCHLLACSPTYLRTWPDKSLTDSQVGELDRMIERRTQGEPIAYILGFRAFWSFDLEVSPDTLIPRADTECLVEQALALSLPKNATVLDLGTGTGAIALALASEQPSWQVTAVDFMPGAVALAERNRTRLGLSNACVIQSDWFSEVSGRFDLIVSNPPYIDPEDPHLDQGDVRFEPKTALIADRHGLADIEIIIDHAPNYLHSGAWLMFEHGYDQGAAVRERLVAAGFSSVRTEQDYGGNDRVTFGCWQAKS